MSARDPNGLLLDDILLTDGDLKSEGLNPQQRQEISNKHKKGNKLASGELFSDPAVDALKSQGLVLEITHVPSGLPLEFAAFITGYDDKYASTWSPVDAYGRMDTMPVYQNTRRSLSLGWDVPSFSVEEAKQNFSKLSMLEKFLYPEYEPGDLGASTIKSPPLLRVKFGNLIMNAETEKGLLGYVGGFNTAPDLEMGFHIEGTKMYPKLFSLSLDLTVLHEHNLGWNRKKFRGGKAGYPYGIIDATNTSQGTETQEKDQSAPPQVQEARASTTLGSGGMMNPGDPSSNI